MVPLVGDLAASYSARCRGVAPDLPPLPVQYADFAAWQRRTLHGPTLEPALRHWTAVLDGLPEASGLPATRPRPAGRSRRGSLVPVIIDPELHRSVVDLAHDSRSTVFMIIHAALAVLLARLGAGPDLAVGTPVAGRSDEALDHLIGFFVNTVVLRTDTSGDPSVRHPAGPGPRRRSGRVRAQRGAVRAGRGGRQAGPSAGSAPAVPGDARRPGPGAPTAAAGSRGDHVDPASRRGAVRAHPRPGRAARRRRPSGRRPGRPRVRHRPVRPRLRRGAGRAAAAGPARDGGGPRSDR